MSTKWFNKHKGVWVVDEAFTEEEMFIIHMVLEQVFADGGIEISDIDPAFVIDTEMIGPLLDKVEAIREIITEHSEILAEKKRVSLIAKEEEDAFDTYRPNDEPTTGVDPYFDFLRDRQEFA